MEINKKQKYINVSLCIAILSYYILISVTNFELVPDFLGIKNLKTPESVYQTIIGTLSSLLGIVIAVVIIQYEILSNTFGKWVNKIIFENKYLLPFFTLSFLSIALGFFSLLSYRGEYNSSEITQVYFSSCLFIASIICLVFVLLNLKSEVHTFDFVKRRIDNLSENDIEKPFKSADQTLDEFLKEIEKSNINFIRHAGQKYVKNGDWVSVGRLIENITQKAVNFSEFGKNQNKTRIQLEFLFFTWRGMIKVAIENNDIYTLNSTNQSIKRIYNYSSDNRLKLITLGPLDDFISNYFVHELFKYNQTEALEGCVKVITDNIKNQLFKNCPKVKEIGSVFDFETRISKTYYDDYDIDSLSQWTQIVSYCYILNNIVSKAIETNSYKLIVEIKGEIESLIREVICFNGNLNENLKGQIIFSIQNQFAYQVIEWFNLHGNKSTTTDLTLKDLLNHTNLKKMLDKNYHFTVRIVENQFYFLFQLHKNNLLDKIISLSNVFSYGKISSQDYNNNELSQKIYHLTLKCITTFKKLFEKDLKKYWEFYSQIDKGLKNLKSYSEREINDPKAIEKLDQLINGLKDYSKYGKDDFLK